MQPPEASIIQRLKKIDWGAISLIFSAAAVLVYGYFFRIHIPHYNYRVELHNEIIDGVAASPFRYRVLVPIFTQGLWLLFATIVPERQAFHLAYSLYETAAIFFSLTALYAWLREWFAREVSLVGVLFVAATMPLSLQDHAYQPWSLLEFGFLALGLLLAYRERYWALAIIVGLASLNRETGLFVALAFAATALAPIAYPKNMARPSGKAVWLSAVYLALWAAIFFGLRLIRGGAPQVEPLATVWASNTDLENMRKIIANNLLFLGSFWLFAVLGIRRAPMFVKNAALIWLPYFILITIYNRWYEVRLVMTMYPILIPLGLFYLFPPEIPRTED